MPVAQLQDRHSGAPTSAQAAELGLVEGCCGRRRPLEVSPSSVGAQQASRQALGTLCEDGENEALVREL